MLSVGLFFGALVWSRIALFRLFCLSVSTGSLSRILYELTPVSCLVVSCFF